MNSKIREAFLETINSIEWKEVFRIFTLTMTAVTASGFILSGVIWAVATLSFWPMLLLVPGIFLACVFAVMAT